MFPRIAMVGMFLCVGLDTLQASRSFAQGSPLSAQKSEENWIGYTQLKTNQSGGRFENIRTMRAYVGRVDGSQASEVVPSVIQSEFEWTQFAGWSPHGAEAVVLHGWEDPVNAKWEEEHRQFRFDPEAWRLDILLVDRDAKRITNISEVERVSHYNSGLFFWPNDETRLGFTALIDGESHPFTMRRDGTKKSDLTKGKSGFSYGYSSSPDGRRIAFHQNYQIVIANQDGSEPRPVSTGDPFQFAPQWSPDSQSLLFLSGEHYHCHPYLWTSDGQRPRKLADRGAYAGTIDFLDVPDFHGGSSDVPVWSSSGKSIYFTTLMEGRVEMCESDLEGNINVLSRNHRGTHFYHPTPSKNGAYLLCGAKVDGIRQLVVYDRQKGTWTTVTRNGIGEASMWPHWRPAIPSRLP
ncbi:MAG: hypothetical protein U0905_02000 [Pirellulales bacterium]